MAYKPWKSSDSVVLNPQEFSGGYLGKFNFNMKLLALKVFMFCQPTDLFHC